MKKQIKHWRTLTIAFIILIAIIPPSGEIQAQSLSSPVLSPIINTGDHLILDWSDITFHSLANRTYYQVHSYLTNPNYSVGEYFPETSIITIPIVNLKESGIYHFVVKAVEETIEITNGLENVTQRIESTWSNMEAYTHTIPEILPRDNWKGTYWEKIMITPGKIKTIIYQDHIRFWDIEESTWKIVDFEEKPNFYLARNAQVGVRFRDAYSEFFNVAENLSKVGAERWRVQGLVNDTWEFLTINNATRSFLYTTDWVNLTRTQDIIFNSVNVGSLTSTISLGKGIVKYTVTVNPLRNGTIRLVWEFADINADKLKYLNNEELISDKLIDAQKLTFFNGSQFSLKVNWFDVNPTLFQGCRVFKQNEQVLARAFFGNWTLTPGNPIELDPTLTTINTPSADITYKDHETYEFLALLKFDLSIVIGDIVLSANLKLNILQITGTQDNDYTLWRLVNQTWDESTDTSILNETRDNEINGTSLSVGWNDLDVTNIVTADIEASNNNCSIRMEDPDRYFTYPTTSSSLSKQDLTYVTIGASNFPTPLISETIDIYASEYGALDAPKLEIYTASPGAESETGQTINLSIQPDIIIPTRIRGLTIRDGGDTGTQVQYWGESWAKMRTADGGTANFRWGGSIDSAFITFVFESSHSRSANNLNYNISATYGAGSGTVYAYDFNPAIGTINSGSNIEGTHTIMNNNWNNGELEIQVKGTMASANMIQLKIDVLTLDFDAITEKRTLDRLRNGTQVLETMAWTSLAPNDTLTLTNIPQSYSLSQIYPAVDTTDTISSDGTLILTNTTTTTYNIIFDTTSTIHQIHFAHSYPDGLGTLATWDEVRWFLNDSQVEHNDYPIFSGYYELEIYDYFNEMIATDTIILTGTDTYLYRHEIELPLYLGELHNSDVAPYRLELTRNEITRAYPMAPKGGTIIRLYGLETNVPYTVVIFNDNNNQQMADYTLKVGTSPFSINANYDNDEQIDFPPYNWIEQDLRTVSKQVTGAVQVVIIIGGGIFVAIFFQTRGIGQKLLTRPIAKKGDKR